MVRSKPRSVVSAELVERRIYLVRGRKVMLDCDLAQLYKVPTKALNQQVRRNPGRFPADFMFQLTLQEGEALRSHLAASDPEALRSQFVTSNVARGGRRYLPLAFTEQGVAMLSSVLKSRRAVAVNVAIMRAFVKLREMVSANRELAARLQALERRCDSRFKRVFTVIRKLIGPPPAEPKRRIGFLAAGTAPRCR